MERISLRSDRLERCSRIAELQHGVVTRPQAFGAGLTSSTIHRLTAAGLWTCLQPCVYALWKPEAVVERCMQDLTAAVLWVGRPCAVSRRAAAALWELDGQQGTTLVEVSTSRAIRSVRLDTKVRRVRSLPAEDIRIVAGLPVTSVARTIVELAGVVAPAELELALESALRRRLTTISRLRTQIENAPLTSPGIGLVRALVSEGPTVPTESALEAGLWRILRRSGLPLPARQHEVRDRRGRLVARLDFAYPHARLGIEADGYRFHSGRRVWRRDIERHNALIELGWTVLRFTWEDLQRREAAVAGRVRRFLSERLPAP